MSSGVRLSRCPRPVYVSQVHHLIFFAENIGETRVSEYGAAAASDRPRTSVVFSRRCGLSGLCGPCRQCCRARCRVRDPLVSWLCLRLPAFSVQTTSSDHSILRCLFLVERDPDQPGDLSINFLNLDQVTDLEHHPAHLRRVPWTTLVWWRFRFRAFRVARCLFGAPIPLLIWVIFSFLLTCRLHDHTVAARQLLAGDPTQTGTLSRVIMRFNPFIVALAMLCGLLEPSDFDRIFCIPAHSRTARTLLPAITPAPGAAGLSRLCRLRTLRSLRAGLSRGAQALPPCDRLAISTPLRMASLTSLALPMPRPTFDLPSPTATRALKLKRRPPFTTFAHRLIVMTFSISSLFSLLKSNSFTPYQEFPDDYFLRVHT